MTDSLGRNIDYMRVSITDRCNLRCKYCMPDDLPFISHDDILRYEEILPICKAAANEGIRIIRVTGGEPLVRKGCVEFLKSLKAISGIEHVALTTNGILLEPYIDTLAAIKLDCVNISLDCLNAEIYRQITGQDAFSNVWRSLHKAVESGLRVKINCVPVKGLNETEIVPIAKLAENMPIDVRYIELMPTSEDMGLERVTDAEILDRLLSAYPDLTPDGQKHGFGPARYYKSAKLRGGIGIISAIGNCFCSECNRIRLTSEGFLKACLFHDDGLNLREMLRNGACESEIQAAVAHVINNKPERHLLESRQAGINKMSRIGG